MRKIYSIEGNIGSGKSTFLALLKLHLPQVQVIPEPVAEWQKVSNQYNLLELYYRDPARWAFTFQINAILSRMKELSRLMQHMDTEMLASRQGKLEAAKSVFFSERSIVADREIFARLLQAEGKMSEVEHALYLSMYNSLESLFHTPRIHQFIYLRTSPQKCLERTKQRARSEEVSIQLPYFRKIHELHEEWLRESPHAIAIDAEQEFERDEGRALQMVGEVKKFLEL